MLDESITKDGLTLRFFYDEYAESPREWDNVGTMACFHGRYNLGDKTDIDSGMFDGWDEMYEYIQKELKAVVILPLYLYDHSGITIRTTGFSCGWDSGQVGFIYATRESIKSMMGWVKLTSKRLERIVEILQSEVKEYDAYLRGEVYGWTIQDENGDTIDSCSGYVVPDEKGKEYLLEDGKSELNAHAKYRRENESVYQRIQRESIIDEEERLIILEFALTAMGEADTFDRIAEGMDVDDKVMCGIRDKLYNYMNPVEVPE